MVLPNLKLYDQPPVELVKGHHPGYTGFIPGRDDSYGETFAVRSARFNSPRDDGTPRYPPMVEMYSTSAGVVGAPKEAFDENEETPQVPKLKLTAHKGEEQLMRELLLDQDPPRAIAPSSVRYNTVKGLTEAQINLVRKLDVAACSLEGVVSRVEEEPVLIVVNIPAAAIALKMSEELLRAKCLSLPAARLIREQINEAGRKGSLNGVAIPEGQWETALSCARS